MRRRSARAGHDLRRVVFVVPDWFAVRITLGSTPSAPIDSPRLRTSRNFALISGEGGQDLSLLGLGHVEVIKSVGKFRRDFVEHGGCDLQVEMRIAQLSAGVLEWPPANEASHKVLPHLRPGSRVRYVTVCHSCNSGFASTIFGFFSSRSLKLSITAAMAKMPPRRS
jgi:hypothetical protein